MRNFIVFPAIDLRYGKVVRLRQGDGNRQKVYGDNPKYAAQDWIDQGAEWLHVVNLNGAFGEGSKENEAAVKEIIQAAGDRVKIQLGGGLRTVFQIETALALGVTRVVLGTAVIENPEVGEVLLDKFGGEKIVFGFDAHGQELMSRGWQFHSGMDMVTLARWLALVGANTLIYTNIKRDGMETGVDWKNARQLADQSALNVVASGGVSTLGDVATVQAAGLAGVIIGRALYEGNFSLQEALNVHQADNPLP